MSESDGGPGQREVAYRLFATEFDDADFSYSESDEERAPNYVITPTGARVNRLFVVGVLTEVEDVSDDVLRARVVDPTGAFVLYAGQYQPDERAKLERTDPPAFLAVTGKARTFQPEDSDRVFTSIRPESVTEVDAETRDRWNVQAAEQTLSRIGTMAAALELGLQGGDLERVLREGSVDEGLAAGIPLAIDHYGTTPTYLDALRSVAVDVARLVADEIDEVDGLTVSPGDMGDATVEDLLAAGTPIETEGIDAESVGDLAGDAALEEEQTGTTEASSESTDDAIDQEEPAPPEPSESEPVAEDEAESGRTSETAEPGDTDVETGSKAVETDVQAGTESIGTETESESEAPAGESGAAAATTVDSAEDEGTESTETGEAESDESESAADESVETTGPGEFSLDESERSEIEEEYGTDFQTGTDVDEPGEADIETPDPEDVDPSSGGPESDTPESTEPAAADESADADGDAAESESEQEPSGEAEADEPVDLEDAVLAAMTDLDDGDGAGKEEVVSAVVDRTGESEAAVEEAIQEALMDGLCYEPDDATLKPI